jgi:16S rRNA (cytosine1402-N4)-methyltransferase
MNREAAMYHNPVLAGKVIEGLSIIPGGTYVDATFGGGGHAKDILSGLGDGRLFAFDQDSDAQKNVPDDPRVIFLNQNFRYMNNFLRLHQALPVDGILADLGVSSHQFDQADRGFSIRFPGPLDMRMNMQGSRTARDVINTYEKEDLFRLFKLYGELPNAWKIAGLICQHRTTTAIDTTNQFTQLLSTLAPRGKENKFFAQVFQALRIEVNEELESLKDFLVQTKDALKVGGRLVVISYHSLEDRLVKNFIRAGNFDGEVNKDFYGNPLVPMVSVGKQVSPDSNELNQNPRARSARLRVAEKI